MRLEIAERAALRTEIEDHPADQRRHHRERGRVGQDDETGVRPEVHCRPFLNFSQPSCARACSISMLRTRRRRISLRMAATCSVTNRSVKAITMANSGTSMLLSMVDPP